MGNTIKPKTINYISAEIEVLRTLDIEHVVFLYTNGRRIIIIDKRDYKTVIDYLEIQEFSIDNVAKQKSQYLISF